MKRILIQDLSAHIGEVVHIAGWVDVVRDHGKVAFVVPRDRTGTVQAVGFGDQLASVQALSQQSVVVITGLVKERPEKMRKDELNGALELEVQSVEVLAAAAELPFDMDAELNLDTYLDNLPLTLRTQRARDIFTLQATITESFREYLHEHGFTEYQPPALVGGDAEGGSAVFKVDYYHDKAAYLASSPQLYKQMMVGVFERVFGISKVFRAEESATTRHLSEYSSMDFEMGFISDYKDVMKMTEGVYQHICARVAGRHGDIFARMGVELPKAPAQFPVLTLHEAQEVIEKEFGGKAVGEPDLEPEHERQICQWARAQHDSDFIFITHYPVSKRPFYTMPDSEQPGMTASFDLLFRGVEITTGGQRVHDHEMLIEKMRSKGLEPEKFAYYLQAFKYGMPPHGGTGSGLERVTAKMLDVTNVKEATLFPRDMNRIDVRLTQEGQ